MPRLAHVYRLGLKELQSLRSDPVLLLLIVYAFSFSVYSAARDAGIDVNDAAVAIVDEDRSPLSRRIVEALLPPRFRPPVRIGLDEIDRGLETGRFTFVVDVPADFEADVAAGRTPALQLVVDATAMSQAARGASYLASIATDEIAAFAGVEDQAPVGTVVRARFNPNLDSERFQAVMEVVSNITLLAIILAGAAVIREREHGTLQHLLVMPIRPAEIMLAKVWANGLVVLIAALLSLGIMVRGVLGVPIHGSVAFFAAGAALYLFSITALGIFLATLARSMPQFGLLSIPVFIVMIMLSGSYTPLESIPPLLGGIMQLSPTTHFVRFAQAVLFRGAGPAVAWPELAGVAATGAVFYVSALLRFRTSVAGAEG